MKLESNIIDPYIGQKAEGKIIDYENKKSIQKKELKVFKFESKNQYIKIYTKELCNSSWHHPFKYISSAYILILLFLVFITLNLSISYSQNINS